MMFNSKRIKRLEDEVFGKQSFCPSERSPVRKEMSALSDKVGELEATVMGRSALPSYDPFGGGLRYQTEVIGLKELVQKQNKELTKLKDIVRELTDFVYENVTPKTENNEE